jgi:LysR family pca operon transcriptional activator
MDRGIRLRQLTYFVESARSGSILKASERLHVTQPAITSSLRDLEQKLGAKLLTRNRSGVALTEYGKVFIQYAESVLAEMNTGVARLEAFIKSELGHVSMGAPPINVHHWLPQAITQYKRKHPQVVVTVRPASNDVVLPLLKLGELDFVIGAAGSSDQMAGLVHEVLFQDRVCLTARHGHPLTKKGKVTPTDLADVPWFVPFPYIQFREEMQSIFHRNNLDLPKNLVEASWNIATDYLEQSDAVSILPYNLIAEGIDAGTLVELQTDVALPTNPIGIIRRSNVDLTSTAKALVREIRYATSGRDKRYRGKLDRKGAEGPAAIRPH